MIKIIFLSITTFLLFFISLVHAVHLNRFVEFIWTWTSDQAVPVKLINFYVDPRINLYTENGYSFSSELCKDQKFELIRSVPIGEWEFPEGHEGTPPIFWVDSLDDFIEKANNAKKGQGDEVIIYDTPPNTSFVDEEVGVPVYFLPWKVTSKHTGNLILAPYGNMICEMSNFTNINVTGADTISVFGGVKKYNTFLVTSDDKVDISFSVDLKCVFYYYGDYWYDKQNYFYPYTKGYIQKRVVLGVVSTGCSYPNINCFSYNRENNNTKLYTISGEQSLVVTTTPSEPKIEIKSILTQNKLFPKSSTYIKLHIKNNGNKAVSINDINLNVNSQFFGCESKKIHPESSTECVLSVSPEESVDITGNVNYQYMLCGERQKRNEFISIGNIEVKSSECNDNSECSYMLNGICCENLCYDSAEGMCSDINADGVDEWIKT